MMDKVSEIRLQNLVIGYSESEIIIQSVNLTFFSGNLVALVGRNGVGKTTFFRTFINEIPAIKGKIEVGDVSLQNISSFERSKMVSVVLTSQQNTMGLLARTVVEMGRHPYTNRMGELSKEDITKIDEVISMLEIENLLEKKMEEVSDGERQKIMIARALIQDTPVILLDEPLAFLDYTAKIELLQTLRDLVDRTGKFIVFSSHELKMLPAFVDSVLAIRDSKMELIADDVSEYLDEVFGVAKTLSK